MAEEKPDSLSDIFRAVRETGDAAEGLRRVELLIRHQSPGEADRVLQEKLYNAAANLSMRTGNFGKGARYALQALEWTSGDFKNPLLVLLAVGEHQGSYRQFNNAVERILDSNAEQLTDKQHHDL